MADELDPRYTQLPDGSPGRPAAIPPIGIDPPFDSRLWPSERAKACVGQQVHYTGNRPDRDLDGIVVAAEWTATTVVTEHGTFPGVRFKIRPLDGRRAFWTCAMPDTGDGR